ncbi:MAG: aldo/keto reductase [Gemmatimonadota bacterium]|jgi:aryl-alcohol dehydrogenase-like predicted oxidoreductase
MTFEEYRTLGRTGLEVSRIGISGGYGLSAPAVQKAFHEFGINYFYWVTRKPGMEAALREIARSGREKVIIAAQSYSRSGFFLERSVEKALSDLATDYLDIFFLGWFNHMPRSALLDRALKLKEIGKVRFLGVTGHNREFHGEMARREDTPFDVLQVRYNAAHRGAETDVFQGLPEVRPGISTYTATRWGKLLRAKKMPLGEAPMTAADCYRFALSHPAVDNCLAGPRDETQMLEGMKALSLGPMDAMELERARRIGDHVHG